MCDASGQLGQKRNGIPVGMVVEPVRFHFDVLAQNVGSHQFCSLDIVQQSLVCRGSVFAIRPEPLHQSHG